MGTIVHPVFKFNGLKGHDPNNLYIIDEIAWYKNDPPNHIMEAATKMRELLPYGFSFHRDVREYDDMDYKILQVAIIQHPTLGPIRIGIVDGPDYPTIKESLDSIDGIVDEKAQFKLNVHEIHGTIQ